ncbi:MAG: rhodanese-like domain-containing protein [Brumimicrobium sp.]|nr:rhodanese-like domain-containing protein [Brumimicrobium sp.]
MSNKKKIIDVRTIQEFQGGNIADSLNIPLNEVPNRIEEIRRMQPVILCCASGGRSGQAAEFLKGHGIECENGGGWMELNYKLNMQNH